MINQILKNKKILLLLILIGVFCISSTALALEVNWPKSPGFGTQLTDSSTLTELVKYIYEWGIALGGLAAFIALTIAGFQYLTSVGDPGKMKEAMSRITAAILGLALLLTSWLILNTINPELTSLKPPTVGVPISNLGSVTIPTSTIDVPCDRITVYSDKNYQGKILERWDTEEVPDWVTNPTILKDEMQCDNFNPESRIKEKDEKSIRFEYLSKETKKLEEGGKCRVVIHSRKNCGGAWDTNAPIYQSVPNTRDLFLSKTMDSIEFGRITNP